MAGGPPPRGPREPGGARPDDELVGGATVVAPLKPVSGTIRDGRPVDADGQPVDLHEPPDAPADAPPAVDDFQDEPTGPALAVPAIHGAATAEAARSVLQGTVFAPNKRAELLAAYGIEEATKAPGKPTTKRQASYLIIDSNTATNTRSGGSFLTIKSELALIKDARDFQISRDDNGNIVIIALSERGAIQKLLAIASSIVQVSPNARMALKGGTLTHHEDYFGIEDYPDTTEQAIWRTAAIVAGGTSIFIDRALATRIQDRDSRLGSGVEIKTEEFAAPGAPATPAAPGAPAAPATSSDFLALIRFTNRIRPESGGPDRLIGYEGELAYLSVYAGTALPEDSEEDETRLTILKASAGMGKSRLISETLVNHPSYLLASVDAADKNVVGSSLVTIAKQLITALIDNQATTLDQLRATKRGTRLVLDGDLLSTSDDPEDTGPITLAEFADLQHADQVEFAAKHPQAVADLCFGALQELTFWKAPNTLLVLEDLHHADRVSLPFLTQLTAKYLRETAGKAVISMRPEEMYRATAIDDLKAAVERDCERKADEDDGGRPVKEIELKGLDFRHANLAYDFAFHSLPVDIRQNRRLGGTWYQTLAQIAGRSPWVMKSLMDSMLETDGDSNYRHLELTADLIDVKPAALSRLSTIRPEEESDLAGYFHERIESLDEPTRVVLQCIALMGGKVNSDQVSRLTSMSSRTVGDYLEVTRKLVVAGYLQKLDDDTYGLQHEATRDIVIGSLKNEESKVRLAVELYDTFGADDKIHPDAKHELLSVIAESSEFAPAVDAPFWRDYANATNASLEHARQHNDTRNIHRIALAALATPVLNNEVGKLRAGQMSPETVQNLCIEALFALAESGRLLGKFATVDDAVAALQAIHAHNAEAVDLDRAHIIRFSQEYMKPNTNNMRQIFGRDLNNGSRLEPAVRVMLEIKLAYREGSNNGVRLNDAIRLFDDNRELLLAHSAEYEQRYKMPLPEFIEIWRIVAANCTLERSRQAMIHPKPEITFDQDVLLQPLAVETAAEGDQDMIRTDLKEAKRAANYIYALKTSFPLILDNYSELGITDLLAHVAAFEGDYEKANRLFREYWRLAMQMEVYPHAARAAKLYGDTKIVQALKKTPPDRKAIKEAIEIYSQQGVDAALSKMSGQSPYQRLLRIQRIRAIAILLTTYGLGLAREGGMLDYTKVAVLTEIKPLLETALDDFRYLNKSWPQTAQDREMCYDIMGYINNILYVVQTINSPQRAEDQRISLDANLYDTSRYPMMNIGAVSAGREFGDTGVTDGPPGKPFGEVARKRGGLNALVEALRAKNERGTASATFRAGIAA